jgi:hypothetical protein
MLSDNVLEGGTNLFFTNTRVASYIISSSTVPHAGNASFGNALTWNGSAYVPTATSTFKILTDDTVEGTTNLYYTAARFNSSVNASTTIAHAGNATQGQVLMWNGSGWIASATATCVAITGSSGLCDGVDDVGAGASKWTETGGLLYPNTNTDLVGIGTTSPYAKFSIHAGASEGLQTLFAVATSTLTGTTTVFSISRTGTTTVSGGLKVASFLYDSTGTGGASGQILQSNGSGVVWADDATFSTTSANYYIAASSTIPHAGNATPGYVLMWDGSAWIAAATSTGGGASQWTEAGGSLYPTTQSDKVGVGTTSSTAKLSIHAGASDGLETLFSVATSTLNSTTTVFSISRTGTTTASNGFNITGGCFAINNTCIGMGQVATTTYTGNGSYTKSANMVLVIVDVWGPGGGGGGGGSVAAGTAATGGGAGGGGAYSSKTFSNTDITGTITITVPSGGTGGTAGTNAAGGDGAAATSDTTFGTLLTGYRGGGGANGNNSATLGGGGGGGGQGAVGNNSTNATGGTGGGPGGAAVGTDNPGYGGAGGGTATNGGSANWGGGGGGGGAAGGTTGRSGGSSMRGGAGGGGGASLAATHASTAGGTGGLSPRATAGGGGAGGAAGTNNGVAGANGAVGFGGAGGGGGGSNATSPSSGGNGAAGGAPGGGGGGGGAGTFSVSGSGGTGGAGGRGQVNVTEIKGSGADLAEIYATNDGTLEAGDVVALDYALHAGVKKSQRPFDTEIVGIVSTRPGLVIGDVEDPDSRAVVVALAGRVPVKVSTENGPIEPGDYLTASSIPGVAMKATKAGRVLGQAFMAYDEPNIGLIMAFVHNSFFQGNSGLLKMPAGLETDATTTPIRIQTGREILHELLWGADTIASSSQISSEIFTDRVIAGLEVVTPRIITKTLEVSNILTTNDDGTISFFGSDTSGTSSSTEAGTSSAPIFFDAEGNASFAGIISSGGLLVNGVPIGSTGIGAGTTTLDTLNALSINTTTLTAPVILDLQNAVAGLQIVASSTQADISEMRGALSQLQGYLSTTTTAFLANAQGALSFDDGIHFTGRVIMHGGLIVDEIGSAEGLVKLMNDVEFFGRPYLNRDTAGFAVVREGAREVAVSFENEYLFNPIVNATMTFEDTGTSSVDSVLDSGISFAVMGKTTTGFTIRLGAPAPIDIPFSWTAFSVRDANRFFSTLPQEPTVPQEPIPETTVGPVTTPIPVSTPTSSAEELPGVASEPDSASAEEALPDFSPSVVPESGAEPAPEQPPVDGASS